MELKVGVIGTGSIGRDHTRRIMTRSSGARVVAVSDINVEVARGIAQDYGARFFERGEDLLWHSDVNAGVDVVFCQLTILGG